MDQTRATLSIVIPAFNASGTIAAALRSIFSELDPAGSEFAEIIVVDDGSEDGDALKHVVQQFEGVRLVQHDRNRGMCAARNTGISHTTGGYVTLLDADDEFISGWHRGFGEIVTSWPDEVFVVFTPCINDLGQRTCSRPDYQGWLTAGDLVEERYSGEYNPIFRGDYIRSRGYVDLGMRKSCGLLTYLRLSREAPFWISTVVQRIYHDGSQSVTSGWTRPAKAAETRRCFEAVLHEHGEFIRDVSGTGYRKLQYKTMIYELLASGRRNLGDCLKAFDRQAIASWFATLAMLTAGRRATAFALNMSKRIGALRRYG